MGWIVDKTHSHIEFAVRHMMMSKVRGSFKEYDVRLDLNETTPEQSYVEAHIKVASIDTGVEDRDTHLRSPDFFDAENYPEMIFKSKRIERVDDTHYRVIGDLTIKNVTREVALDVEVAGPYEDPWGNERLGFVATTKINRKDFGLSWNVALETGGWLVGETVEIEIALEAVKQPQEAPVNA